MSVSNSATSMAYGVEPGHAPYRLRQARYEALARDVAALAGKRSASHGRPLQLLDVGVYNGVSRRYIETHPEAQDIGYHAVDLFPKGRSFVYKHQDWKLHEMDLEYGMPSLPSDSYDVVICEQVLEHLNDIQPLVTDLFRVAAPGGLIVLGVPIYPAGLHLARKHVVPRTDRLFKVKKKRGHVQAFSKASFLKTVRCHCDAEIESLQTRGFRIVSGGILRPLEYHRWWWKLNRWIGSKVPSACIEIQVLATKRAASSSDADGEPRILPFTKGQTRRVSDEPRRARAA